MQPIDIWIDFNKHGPHGQWVYFSLNGGKTWHFWGPCRNASETTQEIINSYLVQIILAPGENNLCPLCKLKGKVGRMQFVRIVEGTKEVCQKFYNADYTCSKDGETYIKDGEIYCRYRVEKCDRCGREDSDYA